MTKIIAVANQKGGVGKTTTAINVGAALMKEGKKVLLIDFDPQGNLSACLGYVPDDRPTISDLMSNEVNGAPCVMTEAIRTSENENIDYIPSTLTLSAAEFFLVTAFSRETVLRRILTKEVAKSYDYIIVDCLPSLGILFVNALSAADRLLIPVQAQKLALDGMQLVMNAYHQIKANINPKLELEGILITMADRTNMSKAVEKTLRDTYGDKVFESHISKSVQASNSSYIQKSLVSISSSKLGRQYEDVAKELLERC